MNKRGAIELSINTLVIIIISLVILSSGITLLYKFVSQAEELKGQLDEQTNAELERLLVDQGKKVALPLDKAAVTRGEGHVFGIGILNVDPAKSQFRIEITLSEAFDESEQTIPFSDEDKRKLVSNWLLYNQEVMMMEQGDHRKEGISVEVPNDAVKGTYIFNTKVFSGDAQYGNTQKFYVSVR